MAKLYSHSKLKTFEQCPRKFKFKYIEKITPEIEGAIESHLGKVVHNTLEWVYKQAKEKKVLTIEQIIQYYAENWQENYKPEIPIIKTEFTQADYFNKGVQFLVDYYNKYTPFQDGTIECEKKVLIELDSDGEYKIQGFIDRVVYNLETQQYEIHDYKTANYLPSQDDIDNDRQLALYGIAIKELFGYDKEIILIWHYLAHNKKIISQRNNEQLQQLKTETIAQIKQIEATTKFPHYISKLCDWCEYKDICPAWNKNIEDKKEKQEELGIFD